MEQDFVLLFTGFQFRMYLYSGIPSMEDRVSINIGKRSVVCEIGMCMEQDFVLLFTGFQFRMYLYPGIPSMEDRVSINIGIIHKLIS